MSVLSLLGFDFAPVSCSGFIFDTEEGAFQEGSLFADEFRISVISDFEQNKLNEEDEQDV